MFAKMMWWKAAAAVEVGAAALAAAVGARAAAAAVAAEAVKGLAGVGGGGSGGGCGGAGWIEEEEGSVRTAARWWGAGLRGVR